jgi:tripartite-type tricarboxylate transporter receptor subunit TctC
MLRLLARVLGVGIETADMLAQEVLARNMRDRRAIARYAGLTGSPDELRALAVTSAKRQEILPDAPALNEFYPGYEANGWYGIGAPKATPTEIIEKLNKEINGALSDPTIKGRLTDLGCNVFAGSPTDFGKFIADETEKWAKLIKFAGIKPE